MNMFNTTYHVRGRLLGACASAMMLLAACGEDDANPTPSDDTTVGSDVPVGQDAASDTTQGADTGTPPVLPEGPVDPNCVDGRYTEVLPPDDADISSILTGYQAANYRDFIADVLEARYPIGANLVADGVAEGARLGHCIDLFVRSTPQASGLVRQISTVVHECGHFLDIAKGGFSGSFYRITPDLEFSCPRIGNDLARSRMNDDEYADLFTEDSYRSIYLDGDPDDAQFQGGDQGFDSVLEETTQYVNSLATDWALRDQIGAGSSISARDGILTFLWYTMRYLRMARLDAPTVYNRIISNSCWRQALLTVWGRAWIYLDVSEGIRSLGLRDARLLELVTDPELLGEIQRVREAEGCAAP